MPEGHCNCKSIRVTIPELPKHSSLCYCSNCKRAGSSAFSIVHVLPTSSVSIHDPNGVLKSYRDGDTRSGNVIVRKFCGECGR
ncbi:hypothetical protein DM02DRAFT_535542 [Periconia macrospinosa]|uniref:CENP-V/GFA domain-containing protein n=1 Tax=Periconia macrospinosa TaxID=97972 RepID=A0A2V1DE77_9PLEO|nr:hypothetical protein DM02DRAFT_535542 [Periconia macrospinosa]